MTRHEVDRTCGQTPCLCGDIEEWHHSCYRGKTPSEVAVAYQQAYQIARTKLRAMANMSQPTY